MKTGMPMDAFEIMAKLKDNSLEQLLSEWIPESTGDKNADARQGSEAQLAELVRSYRAERPRSGSRRQASRRERKPRRPEPVEGNWVPLQQEIKLLCHGTSSGGRFLVINETGAATKLTFQPRAPDNLAAAEWAQVAISFDPQKISLSAGGEALVRIGLDVSGLARHDRQWTFCVDILSDQGNLISKLWVEVVQRS
jgi:hypothetical protein